MSGVLRGKPVKEVLHSLFGAGKFRSCLVDPLANLDQLDPKVSFARFTHGWIPDIGAAGLPDLDESFLRQQLNGGGRGIQGNAVIGRKLAKSGQPTSCRIPVPVLDLCPQQGSQAPTRQLLIPLRHRSHPN
ncbi:hypothetical protein Acsp03_27560 [Actinomadura sp. NBRC 104412]|nr:hypothetical protein Acsp03_27560 [Actinomadura sp. NBRC 104412]